MWQVSPAATVRVDNATGSVTARVVAGKKVTIRRSSPTRAARPDDVSVTKNPKLVVVRCQPTDGARVDVEIDLPYGSELEAATRDGAVSVTGLILRADVVTESGDVTLTAPWDATRLEVSSEEAPKEMSLPKGVKFRQTKARSGEPSWVLRDRLPDMKVTYGLIRVKAASPGRIDLADIAIPEDSPVKLPWQAPAVLDAILKGPERDRAARSRTAETQPKSMAPVEETGTALFRSDVRLVNLVAAVFGRDGHPVTDLKPEDFEVIEDGVRQEVTFAGSESVPFNLALLLDLSGSTQRDRPAMKEAARRFIAITRPHDRVAIYALANNLFHVVSPLTADREGLPAIIDGIPAVGGGTPLYDAIALSYAQEFRQHAEERNALIVISDGIDNQLQGVRTPSKVRFKKLRRAAAEMPVLVYPIFLDPYDKAPPPDWAKEARARLQRLADVSGGRMFAAHSIHDLDAVYPLVEEELRSVYTVAYYPKNQDFDGGWRRVEVRVTRPGSRVRARAGYYTR